METAGDETAMIALIAGLARAQIAHDPAQGTQHVQGLGPLGAQGQFTQFQQALDSGQVGVAAHIIDQQADRGLTPLDPLDRIRQGQQQGAVGMFAMQGAQGLQQVRGWAATKGLQQPREDLGQEVGPLVADPAIEMDGAVRLAAVQDEARLEQGGADAARVRGQGIAQTGLGAFVITLAQGLLRQFALVMGHCGAHGLAEPALEPVGGLQTAAPVLLLLIDVEQTGQGQAAMVAKFRQLLEKAFSAVEEASAHVVLSQFPQGQGPQGLGEILAGHEALMNADGPVHLPPAAKEPPQGQLHLGRLAVHLRQLDEDVDGLVRLIVEQIVETAKIGGVGGPAPASALGAPRRGPPTRGGGQGQEQQDPFAHDGGANLFRGEGGESLGAGESTASVSEARKMRL